MPYKDPIKRRENHNRYMKEVWYPKNAKRHQLLTNKRRNRIRKIVYGWINDYKEKAGCLDCCNKDSRVLDFDHRNSALKTMNVAQMVSCGFSKEAILIEIEKCDVRCSNCHRIKTWERRRNSAKV